LAEGGLRLAIGIDGKAGLTVSHFSKLYFQRVSAAPLNFWMKPVSFGGFLSTESVRFTGMVSESGSGKPECIEPGELVGDFLLEITLGEQRGDERLLELA